jgi:choline dehydrogenase-like flavoprotein
MGLAEEVYDYVVVGSGAGGATVVAARPAEAGRSVLIIEAGSDPSKPAKALPENYDVPAFHALASGNPCKWSKASRYDPASQPLLLGPIGK